MVQWARALPCTINYFSFFFFKIAVTLSKCASIALPAPACRINLSLFLSSLKFFLDHIHMIFEFCKQMRLLSTACTSVSFQDAIEIFNTRRQWRCNCGSAEWSDRSERSLPTLWRCDPSWLRVRLCYTEYLTNCVKMHMQMTMCQFYDNSKVSGRRFTNFFNCTQTSMNCLSSNTWIIFNPLALEQDI